MNDNRVTPKSIIDSLMQFTSREQALRFMESGGFSNSFLKEICADFKRKFELVYIFTTRFHYTAL